MGSYDFDRWQDRLHGRDFAPPVPRGSKPTSGPAAQTASDKDRLKLLEREVKELRRANEILRKAGVRPCGWTVSIDYFDRLLGVLIFELRGAEIAQRRM